MFKPTYRITNYFVNNLQRIALLSKALEKYSLNPSIWKEISQQAFSRDIHSSTWIEGNTLSLAQVSALVEGKDVIAQEDQKLEVRNCINAMQWVIKNSKLPLNSNRILNLHALMTKNLLSPKRSGHWRKIQNYVVNARRKIIFTPPKPQDVKKRMKKLLSWLKNAENEDAVVLSAIFHHEFVTIHPFTDGNGRMARALSQWILIQQGYKSTYSLGLDEYFAADRAKYYQMLRETDDMDGDYTYWIDYFSQGLLKSIEQLSKQLANMKINSGQWTPKQKELLEIVKKQEDIGSSQISKIMDINRARVNQLIAPLVKAGIVIKKGNTRAARYQMM